MRYLAAPLLGLAAACATPEDADERTREPVRSSVFVLAEVLTSSAETRTHATAIAVVARDDRDAALSAEWVGVVPQLPAFGTCRPMQAPRLERMGSPVELAPLREVSVFGERLLPRAYPDLAHAVSGVVYTSPDTAQPNTRTLPVRFVTDAGAALTLPVELPRAARDVGVLDEAGKLTVVWSSDETDTAQVEFVDIQQGEVETRCVGRGVVSVPRTPGVVHVAVSRLGLVRGEAEGQAYELRAVSRVDAM